MLEETGEHEGLTNMAHASPTKSNVRSRAISKQFHEQLTSKWLHLDVRGFEGQQIVPISEDILATKHSYMEPT